MHRITTTFTRRKINIESLSVSESELEGIHRFTIVINETEERVAKVVKQLEKQVEVMKAFYHFENETIFQEIALYKIKTESLVSGVDAERIVRAHNARVLSVEKEFAVIEKTGHKAETQLLFEELSPYGILEFSRSGRIAITKPMKVLKEYLGELEVASRAAN